MLKKIVLIGLAILIPFGMANARYYKRGNQAEQTQQLHEAYVCNADNKSCSCSLDAPDWHDGTVCWCGYPGIPEGVVGHATRFTKAMSQPCNKVHPNYPKSEPLPPAGTGIFKQMKP